MFKLESPFKPTGDQPQAIEKLTKNLKAGVRHQVLLGVTGSGKSVTGGTLVFVKRGEEIICQPIGQLIDGLFQKFAHKILRLKENEILSTDQIEKEDNLETFSLNPITKQSEWKPILQLIRHRSPKSLYRIQTTCGREITVTGDHNFWVLRDGEFILLPTNQIKKTDYLPLPLKIPELEKDLPYLDAFKVLEGENLYVDARPFISQVLLERSSREIIQVLGKHYVFPREKLYQIKSGVYHGMPLIAISRVAQDLKINFSCEDINRAVIGSQIHHYTLPGKIPLTKEWLKLVGYYIAEGHGEPTSRFFSIAATKSTILKDLKKILVKLGLPYRRRRSHNDLQISSKIHTIFLSKLLGTNARSKKLPEFWPNFSRKQLAILLRAYFAGDGGVFLYSREIIAPTASKQLASDLSFALLRFGIWSRVRRIWEKATNSPQHKGNYYWYLAVSGKENITRFKKYIGFELPEKQKRLDKLAKISNATNVDVIPKVGPIIKCIRKKLGIIPQRIFAERCKMSVGTLNAIEIGINSPRRETFKKIVKGFISFKKNSKELNQLINLLSCKWSKIAEVKKVTPKEHYVYDFGVKDNETFLAGFGGMFVHNTFTMANVIDQIQKPTLIIEPNKALGAQVFQELKEFFPKNAIHYFISYYDYYQPEAYIPQSDTYIEKDAKINEEIDRLRHAAVQDLLTRKDIIIIASVSCIYNIGSPEDYQKVSLEIKPGQQIKRKDFISHLTSLQYQRNDIDFKPGTFRVRGNIVDIFLVTGKEILRIEFSGDEIDKILISPAGLNSPFSPVHRPSFILYPAHFWVTPQEKLNIAIENIKLELQEQSRKLKKGRKLLEAQRLKQRTNYDLEMIKETGYCHGIENYSRHLEFRKPGDPPFTLLDYFAYSQHSHKNSQHSDYIIFIDESHQTLPQLRAMAVQDKARKRTLIEYGFRLPSAIDNRPLTYKEFEEKTNKIVYVSATPAEEEKKKALQQAQGRPKYIIEQLIRPTGLLEPSIEVRPVKNQVKDLIEEIKKRTKRKQRVLVLTLTKRLSEAVSDYLTENGIKTQWLHSEVKTLERPQILKNLREGKYDVLVGINLLREGLDLPEVALVAILDADKEGFLRSETTLIQTMGRVARHPEGQVILYADKITKSMKRAIEEVLRRRKIQQAYNKKHNIIPKPIIKEIREWPFGRKKEIASEFWLIRDIKLLEKEMKMAAKNFDFERAAEIRDLILRLRSG